LPLYHDKETNRILPKIDLRLLPMLTLLYVMAFVDRGDIGIAKVVGMNTDLGLTGQQYNPALTVFFFPYAHSSRQQYPSQAYVATRFDSPY
ncbi:MAG: hypothetical protein M1823_008940, partial [Watsoniomyces obsoletus]